MANKDFKKMIKLGDWLERYLSPHTKPGGYKKLFKDAMSFYKNDVMVKDELSTIVIETIFDQPDELKECLLNPASLGEFLDGMIYEDFNGEWGRLLNEMGTIKELHTIVEKSTQSSISSEMSANAEAFFQDMNKIQSHEKIYEVDGMINVIKDARRKAKDFMSVSMNFVNNKDLFLLWDQLFGIITAKRKLISVFMEIINQKHNWTKIFTIPIKHERGIYSQQSTFSDALEIHKRAQDISEVIGFDGEKLTKMYTFADHFRLFSSKENALILFPWTVVSSKIMIDFLFLGGQEYFLFCNYCGKFTVIRRKGRKKFCSDICRTNYGREKKTAEIKHLPTEG